MRSVFLVLALGAVAHASEECSADEATLLQGGVRGRKAVKKHTDTKSVLKNLKHVANHVTTMRREEVDDALQDAHDALAGLSPTIRNQVTQAQQQINDAAAAVQVCHTEDGADTRAFLQSQVDHHSDILADCQSELNGLTVDAERQCAIAQDCLCDEANVRRDDKAELCAAFQTNWELAWCEHNLACTSHVDCHASESVVYDALRADVEAEMVTVELEYVTVEQSTCLMTLIQTAIAAGQPIDPLAMAACNNVDTSALQINYPDMPAQPAACPVANVECGGHGEWTLVLQYGTTAYQRNTGAVDVLRDNQVQFAKLSDQAINALPSDGDAAYDYYMLSSQSNDANARDTIFLRVQGTYDDMSPTLGFTSWHVCQRATFEECTSWETAEGGSRGIDTYYSSAGNSCARWFTGYSNSILCYPDTGSGGRCWAMGNSCGHRIRQDVKMYKKTA